MSKCYFAHGGNELVIGGKLTFLPGASVEGGEGLASVEGGEGLFDLPPGDETVMLPFLADSTATTVAQLREDYNRLLSVLRDAGIIAPLQEVIPDDRDG